MVITPLRGRKTRHGPFRIGVGTLQAGFDYRDNITVPEACTITDVRVTSFGNVTGACQIDLRTAAAGGGSGIAVTLTTGQHSGTATGQSLAVTTSDTLYIRTVAVVGFKEGELEFWS